MPIISYTDLQLFHGKVPAKERADGGIRVHSDGLLGLVLSGPDRDTVLPKIAPAIAAIFKHSKGLDVEVRPERPLSDIMDDTMPCAVDMHVQTQTYIVEFKNAA